MEKKIIAVLGAGPGLGSHIAEGFGKHGLRAILMARRENLIKYASYPEAAKDME